MHTGKGHRRTLGALRYHFPLYSFETGSFTDPGAGLVASNPPAFAPDGTAVIGAHDRAWLFHGC